MALPESGQLKQAKFRCASFVSGLLLQLESAKVASAHVVSIKDMKIGSNFASGIPLSL